MVGRATKRTKANADAIFQNIEIGCTRLLACAAVGMSTDTLVRWEDADASFAARLHEAEGKRDRALMVLIRQAAPTDWKAAAWVLERTRRADYGTNKVEITGKDGGPIKHDHVTRDMTGFTDAEIASLAAVAERQKAPV